MRSGGKVGGRVGTDINSPAEAKAIIDRNIIASSISAINLFNEVAGYVPFMLTVSVLVLATYLITTVILYTHGAARQQYRGIYECHGEASSDSFLFC